MASRRPVIGLTSDMRVEKRTLAFLFSSYYETVERAGALPLQIPPLGDHSLVSDVLAATDGIIVVGGEDLDPSLYGEEPLPGHNQLPRDRESFDVPFARALLAAEHPVLGICYGCQLLAVASGGSLVQDIGQQIGTDVEHQGTYPNLPHHPIDIVPGTRLHALVGSDRIDVNSAHRQAPRRLGEGLVVSATAPDGVIEAFEEEGRFLLGLEWHPDLISERPEQARLFEALVEAADAFASRRGHPIPASDGS